MVEQPRVPLKSAFLCGLTGLFIGAVGFTIYDAEGTSYLSDDPRACVNCHVMREPYDGWQKASHHAFATCNDCHVPQEIVPKYLSKIRNGYHHSKSFTFQRFHEPIRIRPYNAAILEQNCIRCHSELVREMAGHHDAVNCVHCHTNAGHGPIR